MKLPRLLLTSIGAIVALTSMFSVTTADASPRSTTPVGSPAPSNDLAKHLTTVGWRTIFSDDFTSALSDANWWRYGGISSASHSAFDPAQVSVSQGLLRLMDQKQSNGTWHGAGVGSRIGQTYGRWTIRARIEQGPGTTFVALLWPVTPVRGSSPEVDFAEDNGGDRSSMTWTAWSSTGAAVRGMTPIDSTKWHTYQVTWLPSQLTFTVDGRVWGQVSGPTVPTVPMRLALQTEPWTTPTTWEHAVSTTTPPQVTMFVDSVRVEAPIRLPA